MDFIGSCERGDSEIEKGNGTGVDKKVEFNGPTFDSIGRERGERRMQEKVGYNP